jgi:cobalt-zinc-cadmium efflux system outer membrane protein
MFTKSTVFALSSGILLSGCAHVGGLSSRVAPKLERTHTAIPEPVAPTPKAPEYLISSSETEKSVVEAASFQVAPQPTLSPEVGSPEVGNESVLYTLADFEQIALANNPSLAALNSLTQKASGLRQQVGARPNPTLGYFGQQLADRGTDQQGIFVDQEFVRGDKLALNRAVLNHTLAAQRWESETQKYRILTDVRVLYFETAAAQQQLDAIQKFEEVSKRGVEVALERKKADEGSLVEVLQSKTLNSEVALAGERATAAHRGAWRNLTAIAGLPDTRPTQLAPEFGDIQSSPDWDATYQQILLQSPERAVAQALVCEKVSILRREQVQRTPNLETQFGAGYDNGTNSGMINVQVGAPIPVFNKNTGNITAAHAEYTRAVENVKRIEQSIQARLARAAQEFESYLASVQKYESEILPQVKESLQLSEEAYKAGELDFLQVLIVRKSYFESNLQFIQSRAQLAQANAKIEGLLLTGGLDAPQDYTSGDSLRGQSFGGQ